MNYKRFNILILIVYISFGLAYLYLHSIIKTYKNEFGVFKKSVYQSLY